MKLELKLGLANEMRMVQQMCFAVYPKEDLKTAELWLETGYMPDRPPKNFRNLVRRVIFRRDYLCDYVDDGEVMLMADKYGSRL